MNPVGASEISDSCKPLKKRSRASTDVEMASSLYRDTSDSDSRGLNDPQVRLHSVKSNRTLSKNRICWLTPQRYSLCWVTQLLWQNYLKYWSGFVAKWQIDSACKVKFLHSFASLADWIREAFGQSCYSGCWWIWCSVCGLQPVPSRRKFLKKGHSLSCKLYKHCFYITLYIVRLGSR